MRSSLVLLLLALWGSAHCVQYSADFNMAGVMGSVQFNSTSGEAMVNLTGTGMCDALNLSLSVFPVMYGTFQQPCLEAHIGKSVFEFSISSPVSTVNVSSLFTQMSSLDALSLTVTTCNRTKSCAVVRREEQVKTWRARFFTPVAGDVYFRQITGEEGATVLADVYYVQQSAASLTNANVLTSTSSAANCEALLSSADLAGQTTTLGQLSIGSPVTPAKSRLLVSSFDSSAVRYVLLHMNPTNNTVCAQIRRLEEKVVRSRVDMRGIKGVFTFRQACPFHTTMITVNLTNLRSLVGPYHVHHYPLPETRSPPQSRCMNDNIGGHWNPFGVNVSSSAYPSGPGSTHDLYEVGDLSSKHGFLSGLTEFVGSFMDWNFPLFGQNSIVGRSMVIHEPGGARYVCSSIGYPGAVTVGRAVFQFPVVGTALLTQLTSDPDSDVSIFLDLSYGANSTTATKGHNWHVHMYSISSETDDDRMRCGTTGGHWNPFSVNVTDGNYATNCRPGSPFACEIGDFSSKLRTLNLGPVAGALATKSFFTDSTFWLSKAIGRSIVIHAENRGGPRIACANLTQLSFPSATTGTWLGRGISTGSVRFSQDSPQGLTNVAVSLSNLGEIVGGYHVHILPILSGREPCSNDNIMGHFNPFNINTSTDPEPTVGTTDEYEVGDMGGKFGTLRGLAKLQDNFMDSNMPLSGQNSIVGRSVVLHQLDGSRLQCSDISAETINGAEWVTASASFSGTVSGTITLSQQSFPDGSYSDTILEVNLQINSTNSTQAYWFLTENRVSDNNTACNGAGATYNPFNVTEASSTCSADSPLNCEVGDLTARHGTVDLTKRQLFIDSTLQMAGDFTVIQRSLVLRQGNNVIACAALLPQSPSAQQLFPSVSSFSRFDFRNRVSNVLNVSISRITLLPGPLSTDRTDGCQQVTFMVSGNVSSSALSSVRSSALMGQFQESNTICDRDATATTAPTTANTTTSSSSSHGLWAGEAALAITLTATMFLQLWLQH
ncbi:uncharacterized protein cusr [Alosa pseudoharengus]|uniref:uncharacterized protein cusr n=1 Tax=Alosa pseudoharengus TaxID=34774 RepID=UPI003F8B837B